LPLALPPDILRWVSEDAATPAGIGLGESSGPVALSSAAVASSWQESARCSEFFFGEEKQLSQMPKHTRPNDLSLILSFGVLLACCRIAAEASTSVRVKDVGKLIERGGQKGDRSLSPLQKAAYVQTPQQSARGSSTPRAETPGKFGRLSVRWTDPSPQSDDAREHLDGKHSELFPRLEVAFQGRPVWSTLALRNTLSVSRESLRETLPFIAYKFRDGPWKGLWTRFGYDPRTDPQARVWQVSFRR